MACCLMTPNHYLNQCWLTIKGVLWHSPESNFIGIAQDINLKNEFEIVWKTFPHLPGANELKIRCWYSLSKCLCHKDGLEQDCTNSSALALELLQSFAKPSISDYYPSVAGRDQNIHSKLGQYHGCWCPGILALPGHQQPWFWLCIKRIWVRSRRCGCLVTWFCYH